jgi:hypothetical protein
LPYFETTLTASYDALGVCNSTKTKGVEVDAKVGINVNLNAGEVNEAPTFQKDLFDTAWPLFSTCMPVGKEEAKTSEPVAVPTEVPESTARGEPPVETSVPTGEEPSETVDPAPTSEETTEMPTSTMESTLITEAPTLYPTGIVTGTASAGYAIVSSNSTMLSLVERRPSAIYS